MNMRGWRHDYHNHLQSLKAYLQLGQYEDADAYLFELEKDLDSVDALVKAVVDGCRFSIQVDHRKTKADTCAV